MAFNFFGIGIPQISLPKISLPSLPSLPKVSLPAPPKIEIPKITVPDVQRVIPKIITSPIPVVAVAGAVGESVAGAVAGGVPEIKLPTPPKVELPKISLPKIDLPKPAWSGAGTVPGRIITPEEMMHTGIPTGGAVSLPAPPKGGNVLDTVINARNQSYEVGMEQAFSGNVAGGGAQFGATMAADVILPLDLIDVGNKWLTGRGDEIDQEMTLGATIDALGLVGAVFTFGGSYAATRALKAGMKTAKIGGEMGKLSAIRRGVTALGSKAKTKTLTAIAPLTKTSKTTTKTTSAGADVSKLLREQAEAAQKTYAKQMAEMQKAFSKQTKSITKSISGLKPAGEPSKLATGLSRTGSLMTGAALGLGTGAIGLTALGALGAPAPQEVPEDGGGGNGGGGLPGADQSGGLGDDWWNQLLNSLSGGGAYDPSLYEGYDPYSGYYPPGYPDPFGLEPYAQDIAGMLGEVPVVGAPFEAAAQKGFALPALIGAVVLVVLVVAVLRSKKGKTMIGGAKKKVSGVVSGAKKAVGA